MSQPDRVSGEGRAGSFGLAVDDYERGRSGYPTEVVRWLLGDARRVVDLGAGTGKLTELVAPMTSEVLAVEPELSMIKRLRARVPGARAVCGRAHELPIGTGWADCVVVAQAFHWFDAEPVLRELARVLEARGRLGLVWNVRDESVSWVAELTRITGRDNSYQTRSTLTSRPHFELFESKNFSHVQVVDRNVLIAHVRSRSHFLALDREEQSRVTRAVARLCEHHPDLAGKSRFELPYETQAFRSRKA